jgi:hypothetical protein
MEVSELQRSSPTGKRNNPFGKILPMSRKAEGEGGRTADRRRWTQIGKRGTGSETHQAGADLEAHPAISVIFHLRLSACICGLNCRFQVQPSIDAFGIRARGVTDRKNDLLPALFLKPERPELV